ncbi:MAG: cation:proton antiporter [Micropepsaceae bacterium]
MSDSHAAVEVIAYAAGGVAALLGTASLLMPAARRLALPYTVLVAVFGAAVGALLAILPELGGGAARMAALLNETEMPSEALLYLFLPPLLFTAGLHIEMRRLLDDIWPVLVLAIVAVIACCLAVGFALAPFMSADGLSIIGGLESEELLLLALLLGAVVAPTDTAAILSIFRDIGAPRRLSTIVEGESLFNDAAAIALVVVLIAALGGDTSGGVGGAGLELVKQLGGGLLFGFVIGRVTAFIAQAARGFVVAETTLTVMLAYLAFGIAQLIFGVSGIVAVVAAAVTFGARARTRLTPGSWDALKAMWGQLDFWATTLIFVFAAMTVPAVLGTLRWSDLAALGAVYAASLGARVVIVFVVFPLLVRLKLTDPVTPAYRAVLAWGGVRGALTVVLALFVTESGAVLLTGAENARLILVLSFGYVLLTLFVNATTLRLMMRALRLDKLDPRERMVRDRVMALSRARVEEAVTAAAQELGLERPARTVEAEPPAEQLSFEEREQVALIGLANREAELAMQALEHGLVERGIAEIMLAHTSSLADKTRERGVEGYAAMAATIHLPTRGFKFAAWVQRQLGYHGWLAQEIAERYELMLSKGRLMTQLKTFAATELPQVVGHDAAAAAVVQLDTRAKAMAATVSAIETRYPAYAKSVRGLLVERIALSLEEAEYAVQREQAMISEEIYEDLESDRLRRVKAVRARPVLELGLELSGMLARVPLFAGLPEGELAAVAKLLRPALAVNGERVIRNGTMGREMYFLVSGEVDVTTPQGAVRLTPGAFFGEVALLNNARRNADVTAVSFCELLLLRKRDLDALMSGQPALKAEIKARAEARGLQPAAR